MVNTWCKISLLSLNHRHCRSDFVLLAGNVLYFQSISIYSTNLFCLNARIDFRILEISLFFKDTPKEKHIFLNVTKAEVSGFCALPNSSACSYRLAVWAVMLSCMILRFCMCDLYENVPTFKLSRNIQALFEKEWHEHYFTCNFQSNSKFTCEWCRFCELYFTFLWVLIYSPKSFRVSSL